MDAIKKENRLHSGLCLRWWATGESLACMKQITKSNTGYKDVRPAWSSYEQENEIYRLHVCDSVER